MPIEIGTSTEADRDEVRAITAQAFSVDPARLSDSAPRRDPEDIVVARDDGRVVGTTHLIWWGQWFGGRSVSCCGIAGVAVAPEWRGQDVGHRLMTEAIRRVAARGVALSTLYPTTASFYRSFGYQTAGWWGKRRVRTRSLHTVSRGQTKARLMTEEDRVAVRACYDRIAPRHPGWFDRTDYSWRWDQFADGLDPHRYTYVVDGPSGIAGYVRLMHTTGDERIYGVRADHLVFEDREAAQALFRVIRSHATTSEVVAITAGLDDVLTVIGPAAELKIDSEWFWMSRLIDVTAAIDQRGFAPAVRTSVDLDIVDEQFEANAGPRRLVIEDGAGRLEPGGTAQVAVHVRDLASLYTGWASPWDLATVGQLPGATESDIWALSAAFAGPSPSLPDFF